MIKLILNNNNNNNIIIILKVTIRFNSSDTVTTLVT